MMPRNDVVLEHTFKSSSSLSTNHTRQRTYTVGKHSTSTSTSGSLQKWHYIKVRVMGTQATPSTMPHCENAINEALQQLFGNVGGAVPFEVVVTSSKRERKKDETTTILKTVPGEPTRKLMSAIAFTPSTILVASSTYLLTLLEDVV